MVKIPALLLVLLVLPTGLVAQSLGDVAAQEKARREKEKASDTSRKAKPAKAFTDDDLHPGTKTEASPPVEAYVPSTPSREAEVADKEAAEAGPKAEWRARAAAARQVVDTARQAVSSIANDVERIRQDLNPMSLTFNPDDYNLTLRLQHQLSEAEARLAAANQQVGVAEKAYQAFEDDARRNGVPSSWLEPPPPPVE
jgi:hypothetical protein